MGSSSEGSGNSTDSGGPGGRLSRRRKRPSRWRVWLSRWRVWLGARAAAAKRDGIALALAVRDPRVPWPVKAFAALVAAYVLSPIDLIPDFIPVIGFLDELVLLPLAVGLLVRMIDAGVMDDLRKEAARVAQRPVSVTGALLIVCIWIAVAWVVWRALAG